MKKQKRIIEEDGHVFDSSEELHMYWYFKELQDKGYVKKIVTQPPTFPLLDPVKGRYIKEMKRVEDKVIEETLLQGHSYTTDLRVDWNNNAIDLFCVRIKSYIKKSNYQIICNGSFNDYFSFVEVKPIFDQNNMTRLVRNTIKLVFYIHRSFINLCVPEKVFNKTFTPKRFLFTDISKQSRKIKYKNVITLEEFLKKK